MTASRTTTFSRIFRRAPWENAATVLIATGVFMLMQPFSLWLYGWSFAVILTGTVGFVIVSHFPEGRHEARRGTGSTARETEARNG